MAPHVSDLDARKRAARAAALRERAGCDPASGTHLAQHVMGQWTVPAGAVVAGFWPLPGEIDLRPLLYALATSGHKLTLPVTPRRGEALRFRSWAPGEVLVPGRFGTLHPTGPELAPDVFLVPLLAFDRAGRRLGYGGGFYDRTLAARPEAPRLGVAFAAQEIDVVPAGPQDIRLPHVATESGVIACDRKDE